MTLRVPPEIIANLELANKLERDLLDLYGQFADVSFDYNHGVIDFETYDKKAAIIDNNIQSLKDKINKLRRGT